MFLSHSVGLWDRFQNRQWLWSQYHIQQFPQLPDIILIAIDFSKIISCPMRWAATATHTAWHILFPLSIINRSCTYVQLSLFIVMSKCKNYLKFWIHNICRWCSQLFSLPILIYLHYFSQFINCSILLVIIICPLTDSGRRVTTQMSTWAFSFNLGWKPKKHFFVPSVSWASKLGGSHTSSGETTTDIHQIADSYMIRTRDHVSVGVRLFWPQWLDN